MKEFAVISAIIGAVLVLFAVSTAIAAKRCGDSGWKTAFFPVYSFAVLRRLTGPFSVLNIPVTKYARTVMWLLVAAAVSMLLRIFAGSLPEPSKSGLIQISMLPLSVSALIFYLSALKASFKLYRRLSAERYMLWCVLSLALVTVPFITVALTKNPVKSLDDIY